MRINSDSNIKYVFKSKSAQAVIRHVFTKTFKNNVSQALTATAEIRRSNNALVSQNLPVSITRIQDLIPNLSQPNTKLILAELSADISGHTNALSDAYEYYLIFDIKYLENNAVIETSKIAYGFQVISAESAISLIADENDTITPELLNQKLAGVISPGVLYGMEIVKGTGLEMFDLLPGEAIASNGQKMRVLNTNHNIIKSHNIPSSGTRIDAICIDNNANINNIPGVINAGVPQIDENGQTVIGFLILSSQMSSTGQARYIPRLSLTRANEKRYYRKYNHTCEPVSGSQNKKYKISHHIINGSEVIYDKNGRRISPGAYNILPGTESIITFIAAQTTPVTADFDIAKNYYPKTVEDALNIIPSDQQYPWENAQIMLRNPASDTNTDANNIIYGWNNVGTLAPYTKFVVSQSTAHSPNMLLVNNSVFLPYDYNKPVTGLITMNHASQGTHTLICRLSVNRLQPGQIINSNSIEDVNNSGPLSNFGCYLADLETNPRLVFTHCGHRHEMPINSVLNSKITLSFVYDAGTNKAQAYFNTNKLFDISINYPLHLTDLSEVYVRSDLEPGICLFGYWDRAMHSADISAIHGAMAIGQLI